MKLNFYRQKSENLHNPLENGYTVCVILDFQETDVTFENCY